MDYKKNIIKLVSAAAAVIAALLLCSTAALADAYIDDGAELYSDSDEEYLLNLMELCSEETGWNIGIVTDEYGYYSESAVRQAAEHIYDNRFGADSSGLLFLCDVEWRYIVVAGEAELYINADRLDIMLDNIEEYYMDYEDLYAAYSYINYIDKYYNEGPQTEPSASSFVSLRFFLNAATFPLIIGIAVSVIVFLSIAKKYSTYISHSARSYTRSGDIVFNLRTDSFLREHTTKTRASSSSNHHGGGRSSGHHSGGGRSGRRSGHHSGGGRSGRR